MRIEPETLEEITVTWCQERQPWAVPYSNAFMSARYHTPHNMATHATLHAMKSLGKIAAVFEAVDHRGGATLDEERDEIASMAADLFTIALRLANLYGFSLVHALSRRVWDKNKVQLINAPVRVEHIRADRA